MSPQRDEEFIVTKVRITRSEYPELYDLVKAAPVRKRSYIVLTYAGLRLQLHNELTQQQSGLGGLAGGATHVTLESKQQSKEESNYSGPVDECIDNYLDTLSS